MNKQNRTLLLGLVPTRRDLDGEFFCNSNIALQKKDMIEAKLQDLDIEYVNLDFLNDEGIIRNGLDARKVADYFTAKNVDALFCPHLNFGTEDAIAKIGKYMKKPLLLWGMRDDAPDKDGNRHTDSQCGLFATGKVLRQFGVPFTYMTNCTLDDPTFERVLKNFLAAAEVIKAFNGMRIGQIGVRPETFWSVKYNEQQLLERFGIEVIPLSLIELKDMFDNIYHNEKTFLEEELARFYNDYEVAVTRDSLIRTVALKTAIYRWAATYELKGIAASCWGPIREMTTIAPCFTFSELTAIGLPVVCETDVNGAIVSVMAQAATHWTKATFFADLTMRHPTNDNAELLWHCGIFPGRTACKSSKPQIGCNFDEDRPTVSNMQIENGDVTIVRFDSSGDKYHLLMAQGKSVEGPFTKGSYGWVEFENWPMLEHKLVYGPYIHHAAGIHAKISPVLYEACRYIPGLEPDPISPGSKELEEYLM
jgi:L-fucose isomerase-like protein